MKLELKNISKAFDKLEIFRDFSVSFDENSINCILGPSGCGKTTLLNIINNSTEMDSGNRTDFLNQRISYVFQEPRLLPWKTVEENIAFVLKENHSPEEIKKRTNEYLNIVKLESFRNYYPSKLSGGMKQRVSLARAFSYDSDLILMDEPFKGLDLKLKLSLMDEFKKLWEKEKRTVIFVTHDVDEALETGNIIFLFSNPPVQVTHQFHIPEKQEEKDKLRNVLISKV